MKRTTLLLALTAIGTMLIFAATLYPYFEAHRSGAVAGYGPLLLGVIAIGALSACVTYSVTEVGPSRFWVSFGTAFGVGASFVFLFMLFTLNTLGS